ncbi:MAG: YceD family protein [Zoogloea oleivorans]|uniref:YceD family protein n=1 Tax=Zoogloea oleivorans TaxID=1552750 RepID=UPI002A36B142|nr:YceD family protein [Zoogloea oleivorans]MDY0035652.1 YceD family protein [Zoogloea oleivorans]
MIDLQALAKDGGRVYRTVPVESLGRLVESLLEPVGTVTFEFQGERDDEGKLYVDLQIQGDLVLQCQRCLEAMVWPCNVQNRLLLLRSGEELPENELENDAVDALEVEPLTDLLALVEDEVLLALPLVPRHENCEPPVKAGVDDEISPFAVLRQLRGKV